MARYSSVIVAALVCAVPASASSWTVPPDGHYETVPPYRVAINIGSTHAITVPSPSPLGLAGHCNAKNTFVLTDAATPIDTAAITSAQVAGTGDLADNECLEKYTRGLKTAELQSLHIGSIVHAHEFYFDETSANTNCSAAENHALWMDLQDSTAFASVGSSCEYSGNFAAGGVWYGWIEDTTKATSVTMPNNTLIVAVETIDDVEATGQWIGFMRDGLSSSGFASPDGNNAATSGTAHDETGLFGITGSAWNGLSKSSAYGGSVTRYAGYAYVSDLFVKPTLTDFGVGTSNGAWLLDKLTILATTRESPTTSGGGLATGLAAGTATLANKQTTQSTTRGTACGNINESDVLTTSAFLCLNREWGSSNANAAAEASTTVKLAFPTPYSMVNFWSACRTQASFMGDRTSVTALQCYKETDNTNSANISTALSAGYKFKFKFETPNTTQVSGQKVISQGSGATTFADTVVDAVSSAAGTAPTYAADATTAGAGEMGNSICQEILNTASGTGARMPGVKAQYDFVLGASLLQASTVDSATSLIFQPLNCKSDLSAWVNATSVPTSVTLTIGFSDPGTAASGIQHIFHTFKSGATSKLFEKVSIVSGDLFSYKFNIVSTGGAAAVTGTAASPAVQPREFLAVSATSTALVASNGLRNLANTDCEFILHGGTAETNNKPMNIATDQPWLMYLRERVALCDSAAGTDRTKPVSAETTASATVSITLSFVTEGDAKFAYGLIPNALKFTTYTAGDAKTAYDPVASFTMDAASMRFACFKMEKGELDTAASINDPTTPGTSVATTGEPNLASSVCNGTTTGITELKDHYYDGKIARCNTVTAEVSDANSKFSKLPVDIKLGFFSEADMLAVSRALAAKYMDQVLLTATPAGDGESFVKEVVALEADNTTVDPTSAFQKVTVEVTNGAKDWAADPTGTTTYNKSNGNPTKTNSLCAEVGVPEAARCESSVTSLAKDTSADMVLYYTSGYSLKYEVEKQPDTTYHNPGILSATITRSAMLDGLVALSAKTNLKDLDKASTTKEADTSVVIASVVPKMPDEEVWPYQMTWELVTGSDWVAADDQPTKHAVGQAGVSGTICAAEGTGSTAHPFLLDVGWTADEWKHVIRCLNDRGNTFTLWWLSHATMLKHAQMLGKVHKSEEKHTKTTSGETTTTGVTTDKVNVKYLKLGTQPNTKLIQTRTIAVVAGKKGWIEPKDKVFVPSSTAFEVDSSLGSATTLCAAANSHSTMGKAFRCEATATTIAADGTADVIIHWLDKGQMRMDLQTASTKFDATETDVDTTFVDIKDLKPTTTVPLVVNVTAGAKGDTTVTKASPAGSGNVTLANSLCLVMQKHMDTAMMDYAIRCNSEAEKFETGDVPAVTLEYLDDLDQNQVAGYLYNYNGCGKDDIKSFSFTPYALKVTIVAESAYDASKTTTPCVEKASRRRRHLAAADSSTLCKNFIKALGENVAVAGCSHDACVKDTECALNLVFSSEAMKADASAAAIAVSTGFGAVKTDQSSTTTTDPTDPGKTTDMDKPSSASHSLSAFTVVYLVAASVALVAA